MGDANILNKLPVSASNLYAKNMYNFIDNMFNKEIKNFELNLKDEIIEKHFGKMMEIDPFIFRIKYIYIINICRILCSMECYAFSTYSPNVCNKRYFICNNSWSYNSCISRFIIRYL